nr:MAG TPA: hypothetical protein [Caudoviricetes sp.]DAR86114.1 MAG TPA: hypothetical protein [Caudoviricetes sp.]
MSFLIFSAMTEKIKNFRPDGLEQADNDVGLI